jgi:hypothetical protein
MKDTRLNYVNVSNDAQTIVWKLLKEHPAVSALTKNVLDKEPEKFNMGVGYPLLIIPEPSLSDSTIGMRKHSLTLFFDCASYTLQTKVMRQLNMAIRQALSENRVFLMKHNIHNVSIASYPEPYPLDDGRMAYRCSIGIEAEMTVNGEND